MSSRSLRLVLWSTVSAEPLFVLRLELSAVPAFLAWSARRRSYDTEPS